MLTVTNYGAACCVIEGGGVRILCDPWLFGTIYYGTWEREHALTDPVASLGRIDLIWISHCHDDHYHPDSIRAVRAANPGAKVIIGEAPYLAKIMNRDGIGHWHIPTICEEGGIRFAVIPNGGYEHDNIDTALVVWDDESAVVNLNDCPYDRVQVQAINALTAHRHITALLPYTGAGPWPQCYEMPETDMRSAADAKKARFIAQFARYREALGAHVAVPFSAGYRLRGPLACLNGLRGIPEPSEVPGATPLPVAGVSPYVWELDPTPDDAAIHQALLAAAMRAPKVDGDPLTIDLNWGTSAAYVDATYAPAVRAHETITVEPRLLHGLLTRKYHWNTAEVGSCLRIKRHGSEYDARVFSYLYRLHA